MNTVENLPEITVPAAHNSGQTLKLIADNRFEQPVVHIAIINRAGEFVVAHDAPREALVTALAQILTGQSDTTDEPTGETPPETTLDAIHDALASPEPLTVADLSAKHIGKTMRITNGTDVFTGHLTGIEFAVDRLMCGDRVAAVRALFEEAHIAYPLTATVEVL